MLQFIFMVSKKPLTSNTALSFNQSMPGKDLGLKGGGKGAEGSGRVIWKIVRISEKMLATPLLAKKTFNISGFR